MKALRHLARAIACVTAMATASLAFADDYPSHTIKLIVAYGPGSGADIIARVLAQELSKRLNTSVVVENHEGAGGATGTFLAARSAADGYTVLLAPTTLTVTPHMQNPKQYDAVRDFTPIARVAVLPMAIIAPKDAPYRNLNELIAYAKAHPGELSYATSGKGSPSHLEMERIRKRAGIDVRDVPYKSVGQAMTDTIGGRIAFYFPVFPAALPQIKGDRVTGLAYGGPARSEQAPDLPTIAEQRNEPGYEASVWYGLVAPKNVPVSIVQRLASETLKVLEDPRVRDEIAKTGSQVAPMDSARFAAFVASENAKWGGLVTELGLQE